MKKYNDLLIRQTDALNGADGSDNVQPATKVWIVTAETRNLASLYDGEDINTANQIQNPITTDDYGRMSFYVEDGDYDFYINFNTDIEFKVKSKEPIYDVKGPTVAFNHSNATNRDAVGSHDDIYIRTRTLSQAISEDAPDGTRYIITDLDEARYDIVLAADTGGFYQTGLASGRKLRLVTEGWMSYEKFGADGTGTTIATPTLAAAHATGYKYLYAKPNAVYLHNGDPIYLTSDSITILGNAVVRFNAGSYSKHLFLFKTNDDITYNPLTAIVKNFKVIGGVIDGNNDNISFTGTFGCAAMRAQNTENCSWENPKIFNMPGADGVYAAIGAFFSRDFVVTEPDIYNTDRQGVMFWESTGKVEGGQIRKSRQREPVIASSENSVAFQGSDVDIIRVKLDNAETVNGSRCVRFSGKSSGRVERCKLYGLNSASGNSSFFGVYVTFGADHNVVVENNDIYNCYRGLKADTDAGNKFIQSKNNRYYDCDRPLDFIFSGSKSSVTSEDDKFFGVIDRPFNIDFVPKVDIRNLYTEGGATNAFINNYKSLNIDGLEISGNTAASYCLNLGTRSGSIIGKVEGLKLHDNTANTVTTNSNVFTDNNDITDFVGNGLKLGRIGKHFIWPTNTGVWYTKSTEPTSETDGTIIGSQA